MYTILVSIVAADGLVMKGAKTSVDTVLTKLRSHVWTQHLECANDWPYLHITQCIIQNRNVHISVLNGALWDMEQVHYGIYDIWYISSHALYTMSVFNNNCEIKCKSEIWFIALCLLSYSTPRIHIRLCALSYQYLSLTRLYMNARLSW